MPRRPPSKPYTGQLAERVPDLSWTEEEVWPLLVQRLELLFDHYDIPIGDTDAPDMWAKLAFELACDHVPGFQLAESRGARPYPVDDDVTIYMALSAAKDRGKNIAQACPRQRPNRRGRGRLVRCSCRGPLQPRAPYRS